MNNLELISQVELSRRTGKSKQAISILANRREPPFDVVLVGKRPLIQLSERTLNWIKNNKKN